MPLDFLSRNGQVHKLQYSANQYRANMMPAKDDLVAKGFGEPERPLGPTMMSHGHPSDKTPGSGYSVNKPR